MKLKHILILQNKIDLIRETQAQEQHEQIVRFIEGTVAEGAPIIPISAQLKYNIEVVCEYIEKKIPVPIRDFTSEPHLIIIRSFDVNKPGSEVDDLKGGVAGGKILRPFLTPLAILNALFINFDDSCHFERAPPLSFWASMMTILDAPCHFERPWTYF